MIVTCVMTSLLVALMALVEAVFSCSCMPTHPQQHFCNADFVIKARVKGSKPIYNELVNDVLGHNVTDTFPIQTMYHLRISKIFKQTEAFSNVSHLELYTPSSGPACGIAELTQDTKYLITGIVSGGKAYVSLCNSWVQAWDQVHVRHRKGVQFIFEKHCHCQVKACFDDVSCSQKKAGTGSECLWPFLSDAHDCYGKYAMCQDRQGTCTWARPKVWKSCMAKALDEP